MRGKVILGMSAISLALVGVVFATAVNDRGVVYSPIKATDPEYTLTAITGVDTDGGTGVIPTAEGHDIGFVFSKYTKQDLYFGDLFKGGYIRNSDIIHAIHFIDLNISGEVKVYHGYSDGNSVVFNQTDVATFTSGNHTLDLSASRPTYFKIEASGEGTTRINSFAVRYGCNVQTTSSTFTIRVRKPTVGGDRSINYGNRLWLNTNAATDDWQTYEMVEDTDTYYYTFHDVKVGTERIATQAYTFSLFLSDSTGDMLEWAYRFDYGVSYGFAIYEGQDEFYVDETFNFASQPVPADTSFTLNLNLFAHGGSGATNLTHYKFVYRQATSGDYNWDTVIGWDVNDTYSLDVEGLDKTKPLQFKIYIWHNSTDGESYITPKGADYFEYIPSEAESQSLMVGFDYPVTGNTTGIMAEGTDNNPSTTMSFADQTVFIHRNSVKINPVFNGNSQPFSWEYSGENIRIDEDGNIIGLKAGTTTTVTLTSLKGLTCSFDVTVPSSTYTATDTRDLSYNGGGSVTSEWEGWFNEPKADEVAGFNDDFWNGADISSVKALYDSGSKFYNTDGVEQSLFYILKDHGFNWARVKVWVDPRTVNGRPYGGGESTLENALWVVKEAKAAGMKVLLDFHYSDYWTHPGQQILPKAWASASTSDQLSTYIYNYTKDTLATFEEHGCLPEMVQLGNEISSGSFLQRPGVDSEKYVAGEPNYLSGKKTLGTELSGTVLTVDGLANMNKYINSAVNAVNEDFPSVKTVIHWAKGGDRVATASRINGFFNAITASYDYAGISFYPYYNFDTMTEAGTILAGLNIKSGTVPWFVAETSYPFSGYSYVYEGGVNVAEAAINGWTIDSDESKALDKKSLTLIHDDYAFTGAGQASMIYDLTTAVVNAGGKGMFYWEPAWVPNKYVGWAGEGSACSWTNQGFFSYDGKVLNNIKVFDQMKRS